MNWIAAMAWAVMIGQVVGIVCRIMPQVKNKFVPVIMFAANFLASLLLVVNKFIEAAGLQPTVAALEAHNGVALAGFNWSMLVPILKVIVSALIAAGYIPIQRLIYEKGLKPAFLPDAESKF